MKKVVVTGAGGFIGKALTKRLLELGYLVYAISRMPNELADIASDNLISVTCDFSHYCELSEKISANIDWFIHFAWTGVSGSEGKSLVAQVENIKASAVAMEQAKLMGTKKFLFTGSSYQYRMESMINEGEEVFLRKNLYGLAKEAGTNLLYAAALENGIEFNSVLFTNVFGVGDRSKRSTNMMIGKLLAGKQLDLISGEHFHDWVYIEDAINGILAVLEKGVNGKNYYIGHRKLETFRDIIIRVRDVVAPMAELNFGNYDDKAYIDYSKIDLEQLYQDTGFECSTNFSEGIRQTAEWIKEQLEGK